MSKKTTRLKCILKYDRHRRTSDRITPHIPSHTGLKTSGRCAERVNGFESVHMFIECHYCPSEQPSPDGLLIGLVCGGYVEELRWSGPG